MIGESRSGATTELTIGEEKLVFTGGSSRIDQSGGFVICIGEQSGILMNILG